MSAIEYYDHALNPEECDRLIELFENSPYKTQGVTGSSYGNHINKDIKSSIQIDCNLSDQSDRSGEINKIIIPKLTSCMNEYSNKYTALSHISKWTLTGDYTFQKFETENDGFKGWHTEHGERFPFCYRMMVWTLYLNDAAGTEFMHYETVPAKKGRCAIWPSSWEYVHRSEANRNTKYILSGWMSYVLPMPLIEGLRGVHDQYDA